MRARIGKDIKIRWAVLTDGSALPLVKEELTLDMTAPNGRTQSMEFEVEGNVLTTMFYGKDQNYTGDYMLTLWKNKGKEGQSVVDKTSAFSLVRYTPQEDPAQKHDNLSATLADLGDTSLVTIDGASETTLVCNLTGYKAVEDVGDLPMEPSTIGYLVGDNLYVYVGEGGDVRLGAYKNCGPFRGLKGDTGAQGPQGNSGYQGAVGELQVVNNLTEGGEAAALSAEQGKVLDEKKQDKLQTYHETEGYENASVGVENVFHVEASCGDKDTRSALLIVDKDETEVAEERTAMLYTENDTTGNGNYIQAGKEAVLLKSSKPGVASEVQVSPEKISMSSPSVEIEDVVGTIKELVDYMATDKTDDEQINVTLNQHEARFEELTNSVQMLRDETEDLQSMRDTIDSLSTNKADKSALEETNKEVTKKQNKLNNYIEKPSNGSVEIFSQDIVTMRNDSQGGVASVEVYNEDNTEGVVPVARMSAEKEIGDYAYIEARGNEVNIVGDYVNVNGFDLMQTIEDVATLNGTGEGSVSKTVTDEIAKVVAKAPSDFDTLKEIADYIASDKTNAAEINNTLAALTTRVYELGDFPTSGDAERKAEEETISRNSDISIIHYTVNNGATSHIILQDVNSNLTQQVLYYGGNTYIRHIGAGLNASWEKTNPTNIKYNPDSHRLALMHMVNQYGEGDNNIDWVELPTATDSKDGLMTKKQVKSLEGKQDRLANYVEEPRGKTTIKYPNGKATVEVSNARAALWANDNKVAIAADRNGTRMLYNKTGEDGVIEHRDEISIGRHDDSTATHITLTSKSINEVDGEKVTQTSSMQVTPEGISMSSPEVSIDATSNITLRTEDAEGNSAYIDMRGGEKPELNIYTDSELTIYGTDSVSVSSDNNIEFSANSSMSIKATDAISMQSGEDVIEDVVKEINEKAPKVGYAPELKVDFAKELVGRGEATPEVIGGIRPTGVRSIGDGNATIERIKGESNVWNQLVNSNTLPKTGVYNDIELTNNNDGTFTVNGTHLSSTASILINFGVQKHGHKYLCEGIPSRDAVTEAFFRIHYIEDGNNKVLKAVDETGNCFFSLPTTIDVETRCYFYVRPNYTVTNETYAPKLYNLTLMFGAGNEPKTIEEFEARKPLGVTNEYNKGTIVSYDGEALKSVGFNAWDEEWKVGFLNPDGTVTSGDRIMPKNPIKVIPGQTYITTKTLYYAVYDENMAVIGERLQWIPSKPQEMPSNAAYIIFITDYDYTNIYKNNICIHLAHSYNPEKYPNGYAPYEDDVHPLPDISAIKDANGNQLFPNGLLSAGSVHDEITATKAIKRVGVVDMGTRSWYSNTTSVFTARILTMDKSTSNILLIPYEYKGLYISNIESKGCVVNGNVIIIKDPSYTDVTTFKQAMSGVLLYYELAEPIEVDLPESLNMTYDAWDFGTEELVAKGATTPLNADIVYLFNAVDRIRENSRHVEESEAKLTSMEQRIAQLETMIASLTNTANDE